MAESGFSEYHINLFWPTYNDAVEAAGLLPNRFGVDLIPREQLLAFLADLTRELGHYPTIPELRLARNRKGSSFPVAGTFRNNLGSKNEQIEALKEWLERQSGYEDVAAMLFNEKLSLETGPNVDIQTSNQESEDVVRALSESFLPPIISCLAQMSKGDAKMSAACASKGININSEFERRVAIAFKLLGLDVTKLGQGKGRQTDGIARCVDKHWAVIYDAKVRSNDYQLLTDDDRKFREYIEKHGEALNETGFGRYYFAVVSSGFREKEVARARELCRPTYAKACVLVEAEALMRLVEMRLRQGREFRMDALDRYFAETRILRSSDIND